MSAVTDARPLASSRRSTALKREVGMIGLLWAFHGVDHRVGLAVRRPEGPDAAGPTAIISWVIGGLRSWCWP